MTLLWAMTPDMDHVIVWEILSAETTALCDLDRFS